MKREIKFRAYSSHNHKMYPVSNIEWDIDGHIWVTADDGKNGTELIDEEAHLMQYTGVTDKNERKIYEGDIIVTHPKSRYEAPKSGVVQFGGSCPSFGYKTEDGEDYDIWSSNAYRTYEVIGSIFENPELLEGKQ
ncbi:YopX family protein [Lacticaseibacillus paracasei]|uniref:YopX protein n=1 Tax=Lacticaseibacillus paracasei TaxID=1597 RepID=A0A8B3GLR8_LACPA|nr:YopX family protein [Lacticaseibacillus paracasei]RNE28550.1 YopX protein [Lacticaseibacillus paracasei]